MENGQSELRLMTQNIKARTQREQRADDDEVVARILGREITRDDLNSPGGSILITARKIFGEDWHCSVASWGE
jgi:hypothetical protein